MSRVTIYSLDELLSQFGTSQWSISGSNCCFLNCIQISQEAGKLLWYFHLFKNCPQFVVIHTVKGFRVVSEADAFLEFPWLCYNPANVGNLTSSSLAFSTPSFYIWKFSVHIHNLIFIHLTYLLFIWFYVCIFFT